MVISERSRIALAAAVLAAGIPLASVVAQDQGQGQAAAADQAQAEQDLRDFVHYVMIAKPDLARAHLQQLLDSGLSDTELAQLVRRTMSEERFNTALSRGRFVNELSDLIPKLETRVTIGHKGLMRDPERVREAINMLTGTLRQQRMAKDLLMEAGEYAAPALLKVVTDGSDPTLKQRAVSMLEQIGRPVVSPLAEALAKLDAQSQIKVAEILGNIGYSQAAPYLAELAADSSAAASAREAAARAARRVGGETGNLGEQFSILGRRYLIESGAFTNYPAEATNNIWGYDAFVGLVPQPVPTAIFGEVMAMRLARKALQIDPSNSAALTTFIAADLKRENDLPEGETDPVFGDSQYSAELYAMAAGPTILQNVLGLALDQRDTALGRDAIQGLSRTAGGSNLFAGGDRQPILESLRYPDRRVRYDAALALGKAMPASNFQGDFAVVPLLASAIRAGDASYAVVITDDEEDRDQYARWLSSLGYEVVGQGASVNDVSQQVARAAGIDIVVLRQGVNATQQTVQQLRSQSKTAVAPVVIMTARTDLPVLGEAYRTDIRAQVKEAPADEGAFGNIVDDAIMRASGGRITEADAMEYAIEAIATLRDIAISNSPVYSISDAETALIDALSTREGSIRLMVADVLAYIPSDAAQRALFDAAFAASEREQVELLNRAAESAKRHGDRAEERHVARLLEVVRGGGENGEAAARVHGALNLSPENVVKIISD